MLRPTVRRMTIIGLLSSLVVGAGLWLIIGYSAVKVSRRVASTVDHLPHGPRPEPARIGSRR